MINSYRFSHEFWAYLDELVATSPIVIDRPKGSPHPRFAAVIYPLDYGYLEGTTTVDGGGVDIWLGSNDEKFLDAMICTVDLHKKDTEIKLLLGCSEDDKHTILDLVNSESMRGMLIQRESQL